MSFTGTGNFLHDFKYQSRQSPVLGNVQSGPPQVCGSGNETTFRCCIYAKHCRSGKFCLCKFFICYINFWACFLFTLEHTFSHLSEYLHNVSYSVENFCRVSILFCCRPPMKYFQQQKFPNLQYTYSQII